MTLPDRYNGLGFKNLVYMIIEMLDFHGRWKADKDERAALHLLVIEEPEAHLHAQLQQVFIQQIGSILPQQDDSAFATQIIVTTHSSHIVYAKGFESVRYFQRLDAAEGPNRSKVLNLSCLEATGDQSHTFLKQYMKLTHCDLFFADAAVMVEGNVERLLLPLMIERKVPELNSRYISVLEIGGAHAHIFKSLVHFLGVPTLVITDLDSVRPRTTGKSRSCVPEEPSAETSNPVLKEWIPRKRTIAELSAATEEEKAPKPAEGETYVRVAYQTPQLVHLQGEQLLLVGRTLEIAFAYQNLEWCQHPDRERLGLRIRSRSGTKPTLAQAAQTIHHRVTKGNLDKTDFALGLIAADLADPLGWEVPTYIVEGLEWLLQKSTSATGDPGTPPSELRSAGQSE